MLYDLRRNHHVYTNNNIPQIIVCRMNFKPNIRICRTGNLDTVLSGVNSDQSMAHSA